MAEQLKAGLIQATGSMSPGADELGAGAVERWTSARGPPLLVDYLSEHDAAPELRVKLRTLRQWRQQGSGPAWVKIGKLVFYSRGVLLAWIKSQERTPVRSRNSAA
jgi:hypothetical protein